MYLYFNIRKLGQIMTNNEYFLVQHQLSLNVEALIGQPLKLNNETTHALWGYLEAQNLKINTLLSYVLSQQDDKRFHFQSTAFSAGVCLFVDQDNTFYLNQNVRLKIFIPEESAAIYCYAQVSNIDGNNVQLNYQQIREEDRELLIRTTLHIQSKQLKARATQRSTL